LHFFPDVILRKALELCKPLALQGQKLVLSGEAAAKHLTAFLFL
jgi:hypothetical protein